MIFFFPSSWLDYALVIFGSAIGTSTLSSLLPAKWGWKAFPVIFMTPALILAATSLLGVATLSQTSLRSGTLIVSSRLLPISVLAAAVTFAGTLVHRRFSPKGPRTF
jgi:hypothetical protein